MQQFTLIYILYFLSSHTSELVTTIIHNSWDWMFIVFKLVEANKGNRTTSLEWDIIAFISYFQLSNDAVYHLTSSVGLNLEHSRRWWKKRRERVREIIHILLKFHFYQAAVKSIFWYSFCYCLHDSPNNRRYDEEDENNTHSKWRASDDDGKKLNYRVITITFYLISEFTVFVLLSSFLLLLWKWVLIIQLKWTWVIWRKFTFFVNGETMMMIIERRISTPNIVWFFWSSILLIIFGKFQFQRYAMLSRPINVSRRRSHKEKEKKKKSRKIISQLEIGHFRLLEILIFRHPQHKILMLWVMKRIYDNINTTRPRHSKNITHYICQQ